MELKLIAELPCRLQKLMNENCPVSQIEKANQAGRKIDKFQEKSVHSGEFLP